MGNIPIAIIFGFIGLKLRLFSIPAWMVSVRGYIP